MSNNCTSAGHFHTTRKDLILNYYNQTDPGFLKVTVDEQFLYAEYYIANFDGSKPPAAPDDYFTLDWKNNKIVPTE
jgi:hypothetical protein